MSFKQFFKTHLTESEIRSNFDVINESRWWGKFKEDTTSILEYKDTEGRLKKMKVCKMEEDGNGPAYVLEARAGTRYGLFRATEGKFHVIRMKSGKKHLITKPKGMFKEVDGKLVFEIFTLKPMGGKPPIKVGGGKDLIQTAIANKKKPFKADQTIIPKGGSHRIKVNDKPDNTASFDPNATLRERRANVEPDKSFSNGEVTFDKNTDEWNKGVHTDAKS